MNGYRRRSAIVAVALMATMSAGVALAADTGLPPGFIKTGLSSLSTSDATVSNTLARYSLGGTAAVGQALRQSDEAGVATGAGYGSTLRGVTTDNSLASAELAADCGGSSIIDLTNLAQGLTGGASVGRETLASGSLSTANGTYSAPDSLTNARGFSSIGTALLTSGASFSVPAQENGTYGAAIASSRESGDPAADLSQLAGALASDRSEFSSFAASPSNNGSFHRAGISGATTSNVVSSRAYTAAPSINMVRLAEALTGN